MVKSRGNARSQRCRSPLSSDSDEESCRQCGRPGGRQWIACDLCDSWFHTECVTLEFPLEEIHEQEWLCDFCCQKALIS